MRIDFTNEEGYWDEVTNGTQSKKRSFEDHLEFDEWKSRFHRVRQRGTGWKRSNMENPASTDLAVHSHERRWWGVFLDWLAKVTTIESKQVGVLPMAFAKYFNLFSGRIFCRSDTGITFTAGMDITADLQLVMDTRYAYYFSGTVVTPNVTDMYAFVRTQPKVIAGITLSGDASLAYATEPKRLINTLTYPGLAIKGIAAVGPSLDIWGQLDGSVTVSGLMRAGVTYTLKPIEMYMPNTDTTHDRAEKDLNSSSIDQEGLSPTFEANVQAQVDFNVRVSPEINMGIKVGGQIGPFDVSESPRILVNSRSRHIADFKIFQWQGLLVDAHVSAFANTSLNFNAQASGADVNSKYNWAYNYEIALWYRIGLSALATIKFYGEWRSNTYYPVDWQKIKLFGPDEPITSGVESPEASKRLRRRWIWSDDPLPNAVFDTPSMQIWTAEKAYEHVTLKVDGLSDGSRYGNESWEISTRQENNEHADDSKSDLEFTVGGNKFTCNQMPATCGGSMNDDTGDIETRDLGQWYGSLNSHSLSHTKRAPSATDDCAVLPRLFYNCKTAFMDWTFVVPPAQGGTGNPNTMSGICRTLDHLMDDYRSVNTQRGRFSSTRSLCRHNGCTLTYDAGATNQRTRRNQACRTRTTPRRSKCRLDNTVRKTWLWGANGNPPSTDLTSCDEFPFASSEEGGNNYDSDGADMVSLFGTKTVCVPTWQQSLQGNCNGKYSSYNRTWTSSWPAANFYAKGLSVTSRPTFATSTTG